MALPLRLSLVLTTCALAAASARADEVRLKNGDRLTGTITEASGGKLKMTTPAAGDVTVDMAQVETFATDAPVEFRLKDGTVLRERARASDASGAVSTGGETDLDLSAVKTINARPARWTGAVTAGGLVTRGNSNTESFNLSIEAGLRREDDRISANAGYIYSRQADPDGPGKETTADNWFAAGKYDRFFSEKVYGFAALRVEHDTIADLDLRLTPSVGVGYQWVETPDFNFATEAGLAWIYEEYGDGGSDNHIAARLAYHVDRKFNEKVALAHNLEYLPSLEDTGDYNVNADAGVRVTLTKTMFAELKAEWRHDATPAPDAHNNDLRYILGVGWTF